MLVDEVAARIEDQVPELIHRVEQVAELAALQRDGSLPPNMPAAFVLPIGIRGGAADAAAGIFRQETTETVGVVLFTEAAGDGTGGIALPAVDVIGDKIIAAMTGWAPGGEIGVFRLVSARLITFTRGTVIYQIDFSITDQLRITS